MSNTQPTEPLPPHQEPPRQEPPSPPYDGRSVAPPAEPFYKRHGLAFAISTLGLSIVVLLGIVTAGALAVTSVVARGGDRFLSHSQPQQPGVPGMPGRPGDGSGNGKGYGNGGGGQQDGGTQQGQVLVRGTIASLSGDTWTIDRQNGASVDVKVDSATVFGTPQQSASKSDFAEG